MQRVRPESNRPKFSVIIPTRNGQKYIAETLQSVLLQTYKGFSVFVLESGSDDQTLDVVRSFKSGQVHVLSESQALGIEANWARILDLDLDEYMTILGHDDVLYPDFLATIADLIAAHPDASLYQTNFNLIDSSGAVIRRCQPIPSTQTADQYLLSRHNFALDSFATGYVMRSSDYKAIGGLPSELPKLIGADDLAWYRITLLSYKVCAPQVCFGYRYHADSTSYSIDLCTVYQAYRTCCLAFEKTAYFHQAEHRVAARRFFQKSLNGRHHRLLAKLIEEGSPEQWQLYTDDRRCLLAEARVHPAFEVYDLLARLLEGVAKLPPPLRKPVIRAVGWVGQVTRDIRKR